MILRIYLAKTEIIFDLLLIKTHFIRKKCVFNFSFSIFTEITKF